MKRLVSVPLCVLLTVGAWGQSGSEPIGPDQPPDAPSAPKISNSPVEIVSDTLGVNFGPYLRAAVAKIRKNWYSVIPREALPPTLKQGKVVLEFAILKDREVKNLRYSQGSGDVALDRAAYAGITASNPFPPLPSEFTGDHLGIRFTFKYNPGPEDSKLPPLSAEAANEQVRLSEILISTRGCPLCGTPQQLSAAVARCEALLQQIRGGAKFEDVARASSDGSTAAQGGDLGYFPRGRLAKSIEDVVFAMKVDDVSDVIQTNQGFIILRLTEHVGVKSTAPTTPN